MNSKAGGGIEDYHAGEPGDLYAETYGRITVFCLDAMAHAGRVIGFVFLGMVRRRGGGRQQMVAVAQSGAVGGELFGSSGDVYSRESAFMPDEQ